MARAGNGSSSLWEGGGPLSLPVHRHPILEAREAALRGQGLLQAGLVCSSPHLQPPQGQVKGAPGTKTSGKEMQVPTARLSGTGGQGQGPCRP